jgi:putative ABC transport system permease protein
MGQGVRLAAVGVGVGGVLALASAPFVEPLLFQQSATDPVVLMGVSVVLIVVALIACAVPTTKAMRADPNTVLRAD